MRAQSYHRLEKLKSRKTLSLLFTAGNTVSAFPVKAFYVLEEKGTEPVKAGVGVSARHFKKAVHRNRIKRLLRECYRVNKTILSSAVQQKGRSISVFFLYTAKELPTHELLLNKMKTVLLKLEQQID